MWCKYGASAHLALIADANSLSCGARRRIRAAGPEGPHRGGRGKYAVGRQSAWTKGSTLHFHRPGRRDAGGDMGLPAPKCGHDCGDSTMRCPIRPASARISAEGAAEISSAVLLPGEMAEEPRRPVSRTTGSTAPPKGARSASTGWNISRPTPTSSRPLELTAMPAPPTSSAPAFSKRGPRASMRSNISPPMMT